MKLKFFIILFLFIFLACSKDTPQPEPPKSDKVFICTGPMSKAYHKTNNCMGIKNCSKEIREVTLDEAKSLNRHPCRFCH